MICHAILNGRLPGPAIATKSQLSLLDTSGAADRNLRILIGRLRSTLRRLHPDYAIGGSLAASLYMGGLLQIHDMDVYVLAQHLKVTLSLLTRLENAVLHSTSNEGRYTLYFKDLKDVNVDFLFIMGDPQESGLVLAKEQRLLGCQVRVMPLEFLLWSLLLSGLDKHRILLEIVLGCRKVNQGKLVKYLNYVRDLHALNRLREAMQALQYRPRRAKGVVWKILALRRASVTW